MQHEYFGFGAIEHIRSILELEKPRQIFLVRGRTSYQLSGAEQKLNPLLQEYNVTHFVDFSPNAKVEDVEKGIELFREHHGDFVLAVGGGSALDVAKAITLLAPGTESAGKYILRKAPILPRSIPLVAIPTTAGTGSEATHFAAVYFNKIKYSLAHRSLVPDYAVIDPSLTHTLSPYQTACTGMDALAQAMESYWSIHSTEESRHYAQQAITLVLTHLENAVRHSHSEARIGMAKAANLAGKAINISFTTACHAISYPMTSYFDIPHGHAVALTLPEMVVYNAGVNEEGCLDKRGVQYVKGMLENLTGLFGVSSPEEVKKRLEQLMDSIGLERKLTQLGVRSEEDINLVMENGFNPERVGNNPQQLTAAELKSMLRRIK